MNLANPSVPTATSGAGRPGTTPIGAAAVLTDRDVRSVVNELWADGAEAIAPVVRALDEAGVLIASLEVVEPTLDDVFLAKTGERLEDDTAAA